MAKLSPYLEFLLEQFEPLGHITARAMFGGHGLYCDGVFFALVAQAAVYLKADDQNRGDFEAQGLKPFRPFEGEATMSYYQAPPEMFEDAELLKRWAGGALQAGCRALAKKKPKKKPKKNPT